MEGTRKGFDLELIKQVSNSVSVPVIASGGMGTLEHAISALKYADVYALAMADVLHYGRFSPFDIGLQQKRIDKSKRSLMPDVMIIDNGINQYIEYYQRISVLGFGCKIN